jgi:hypothetical protein
MTAPEYRRLLWAYPGAYRRRHGAEIVTTLLEMTEDGRGGLGFGARLHLIACGVRQRFRLPARRPFVLIAAVLAAIAVGAAGSAAGTWLGWQTAAPVPSGRQMIELTLATAGGHEAVALYPQVPGMVAPGTTAMVTSLELGDLERVRAGLVADGWQITQIAERPSGVLTRDGGVTPATEITVSAVKDGLKLNGSAFSMPANAKYDIKQHTMLRLDAWPVETPFVRPLTVAGMLAGMLAGWLLTAAFAGRGRRHHTARQGIASIGVNAYVSGA